MRTRIVLSIIVLLSIAGCVATKPRKQPNVPSSALRSVKVVPSPPLPPMPKGLVIGTSKATTVNAPAPDSPTFQPTDFAITSVSRSGTTIIVEWINGLPPFQLQSKSEVTGGWQTLGAPTNLRKSTNQIPYLASGFLRVQGASTPEPGQFQWVKSGLVSFKATSKSIRTDSYGNVIGVGTYLGTIDFGNGAITNAGGNDVYAVKYLSTGALVWAKRIGNALEDSIGGLATGHANSISLLGAFSGTIDLGGTLFTSMSGPFGISQDVYAANYSASGALIWAKQFGGTSGESAKAICTDANGDVFVAIAFSSPTLIVGTVTLTNAGGNSLALAKLSGITGSTVWARTFPTPDINTLGLTADGIGDVFMTGSFFLVADFGGGPRNSVGQYDAFLAKYRGASGSFIWANTIGNAGPADFGVAVAASPTSHALVTGQCGVGSDFGQGHVAPTTGIFLADYDGAGACRWLQNPNIAGGLDDAGNGVTTDAEGNVFYTGKVNAAVFFGGGQIMPGSPGYFIASLTSDGGFRWAKRSSGSTANGSAVGTDGLGHVIVGGIVDNGTMYFDATLGAADGSVSAPGGGQTTPWVVQFAK